MPWYCLPHLEAALLQVFMTADPETDEEDTRGGPRVAFLIMPAIFARPKPTPKWQYIFAAVLVALTLGSGLQLGLLANIARLPKVGVAAPSSHAASSRACLWQHCGSAGHDLAPAPWGPLWLPQAGCSVFYIGQGACLRCSLACWLSCCGCQR